MHEEIRKTAEVLMQSGKGILAADESTRSCNKRFAEVGVEQTEEAARRWRQLLFMAPGASEYLTGVILYDGTIRQSDDNGVPFPELLQQKGIIPGIKVDQGLEPFSESPQEEVTKGLEGLPERLTEYYAMGARFAKWRAVIKIGDGLPTDGAIRENARRLAQYANMCHEAHIVPMVEPEVLLDPNPDVEHDSLQTLDESREVLERTLRIVFEEVEAAGVDRMGLILKTSMALPGKDSGAHATPDEVADATVAALNAAVPDDVAGVVYLSGGQTTLEATENLQAIIMRGPHAWPMTFSYSRALQEPVLRAWHGDDTQIENAQQIFLHRLRMNAAAREGTYAPEMEGEGPDGAA
jgi:fructose-bisphosphate aldolase class I